MAREIIRAQNGEFIARDIANCIGVDVRSIAWLFTRMKYDGEIYRVRFEGCALGVYASGKRAVYKLSKYHPSKSFLYN